MIPKELTPEEIAKLIEAARQVREKAYAPYSGFKVGAALLADDGHVYQGCTVENAAYSLTNCAERTALFQAVSKGSRKFKAIVIFADTEEYCSPCGACRQVIFEFGQDIMVIQANKHGKYVISSIKELLPSGFNRTILGKGTGE
jgi:cytidine deaminase